MLHTPVSKNCTEGGPPAHGMFMDGHHEKPVPLTVALACDAAYAMPLATTLRSLVESNAHHGPTTVYVLVHEFPAALRTQVEASIPAAAAAIHWLDIDVGRFAGFQTAAGLSPMTFARLLIAEVLPPAVSRVLYLDTDILVLGSLASLWEMDLDHAVIAAVRDGIENLLVQGRVPPRPIPTVNRYFNAGVLLIDLDKWRSLRIMEKSMTYLQLRPDTPYADQDALNVACDGQWKELREQWNYQTLYHHPPSGPAMLPANAQVIHFITGDKPWKASIPNPYASLYDEFRSRTCFARTMPDQIFDGMASGWAQTKLALKQISLVRCALRYVHGRGVPTHQRKGA